MQKPVEGRCLSASKQVSLGEPPGCWDRPGCPWAQPLSGQPVPPTGAALVFLGRQRVGGHGEEGERRRVSGHSRRAPGPPPPCSRRPPRPIPVATTPTRSLSYTRRKATHSGRCGAGRGRDRDPGAGDPGDRDQGAAGRRGRSGPWTRCQGRPMTEKGARFQGAARGPADVGAGKATPRSNAPNATRRGARTPNPASGLLREKPRRPRPTMLCRLDKQMGCTRRLTPREPADFSGLPASAGSGG